MNRLIIVLLMVLITVATGSAQDWRYDEEKDIRHNCDLISRINDEYGQENIMKFPDGDHMNLAYFFDRVFPTCAERNRGGAAATFDDTAAEPETDLEVIAVLDDHELYSIDAVDCSVSLKDRFEEDLNVSLAGSQQDKMSLDVYLPGESQAFEMPNVNTYEVVAYGVELPVRTQWAVGNNFPLGRYTFDAHIYGNSYRFQWLRRDEAVNTIVVTCVELTTEADDEGDVTAYLGDGEVYELQDVDCLISTSRLTEDILSVLVIGENIENVKVEVTYPGMLSPIRMEHVDEMVSPEGEPFRVEGILADTYPTGAYIISVTMDKQTYHFQWDREDADYKTIIFNCPPAEE